eukprot:GEMP01003015.1.p1 GENE.GEMP01003015.1~~GEMP01003015.1.p1  ORF type:complete len:1405 (+),score=248.98 GEMP01003015.1:40-4254(+)
MDPPGDTALSSGRARLSEGPKRQNLSIFSVVFSKNLRVGWKKRTLSTITNVAFFGFGVAALAHLLGSGEGPMQLLTKLLVPFGFFSSAIPIFQHALIDLVTEKSKKLKELQLIYGVTRRSYSASWFLLYAMYALASATLFTLCWVGISSMWPAVSGGIIFLMLLFSFTHIVAVSFFVSTFFSEPRLAAVVGIIILMLCIGLGATTANLDSSMALKWAATMLPSGGTLAMMNSLSKLQYGELGTVYPVTFANMFNHFRIEISTGKFENIMPPGILLVVLFLMTIAYLVLAAFAEAVCIGEFGVRSFSLPTFGARIPRAQGEGGLDVDRLHKVYDKKSVVKDISLSTRPGEIFAILGHNGSGKTTLMNMLVGMTPPTSGTAFVCGYDIRKDMDEVRRHLSFCPQDNVFFDQFTVDMHLAFFGTLRGLTGFGLNESIAYLAGALGLADKRDELCTNLSGGQQRRLWTATALLGECPIVLLDEPTSGMDPQNRRDLWELLAQMRSEGRSIIFTTHYLEEADWLADRKAVLANGEVKAIGTSLDLKHRFGVGYHLNIEPSLGYDATQVLAFLKTYAPDAACEEKCSFGLPWNNVSSFGPLLLDLDEKLTQLKIQDYALSMTSLEHVFLKLGEEHKDDDDLSSSESADFGLDTELVSGPSDDILRRDNFRAMSAVLMEDRQSVEERTREDLVLEEQAAIRREPTWLQCSAKVFVMRMSMFWNLKRELSVQWLLPLLIQWYIATVKPSTENAPADSVGKYQFSTGAINSATFVLYVSLGIGLYAQGFTTMTVQDREIGAKHLCFVHGLHYIPYWMGTFLSNYLICLVPAYLPLVLIAIYDQEIFWYQGLPILVVQAGFYTAAVLLFSYAISFLFSKSATALKLMPLLNLVTGLVCIGTVYLLNVWASLSIQCMDEAGDDCLSIDDLSGLPQTKWARALHYTFSILMPMYNYAGSMVMISFTVSNYATVADENRDSAYIYPCGVGINPETNNPYACNLWDFKNGVVFPFIMTILHVIFLGALVAYIEYHSYNHLGTYVCRRRRKQQDQTHDEPALAEDELAVGIEEGAAEVCAISRKDSDVIAHEQENHVHKPVVISELRHTYTTGSKKVHAVRNLTLGIEEGACFALLGPNGSGKTTTLKILTGDIRPPTSGECRIQQLSTTQSLPLIYKNIGYCPQFDGLWQAMSGRQHLTLYASFRGCQEPRAVVVKALSDVGLAAHADKLVRAYSGGMKRRLSLALALIGSPAVAFLDEPSSGVDAAAKRVLWKRIEARKNQTVVLTTHSMEEADALATQLAIMVNGEIVCLGTSMHLKQKYGNGYQLEITTKNDQEVRETIENEWRGSVIALEQNPGRVVFELDAKKLRLGKVFSYIERIKDASQIDEYSVIHPTLEQVFLRFARAQEEVNADAAVA